MSKQGIIKLEGIVQEALPNTQFRCQTEKGLLRCYLSGKMSVNNINVLPGDKVEIEISPTEHIQNGIGRIVFRKK